MLATLLHGMNAAEQVKRKDSVFNYYKTLIHMRKQYPVFVDGCFEMLVPEHPEVFAYTRTNTDTELLVICNFSEKEARIYIMNRSQNK